MIFDHPMTDWVEQGGGKIICQRSRNVYDPVRIMVGFDIWPHLQGIHRRSSKASGVLSEKDVPRLLHRQVKKELKIDLIGTLKLPFTGSAQTVKIQEINKNFVFLSFCLSVFLSFCLSVFPSFHLSVFLSFCLSVFLSISVFPSFCLSVVVNL